MTAYDVLASIGVTADMIEEIRGVVDEMPHGYELNKLNIKTGKMQQVIEIYPKHPWTDGTIRPVYGGDWKCCDYNVSVYLNTRI